MQTKYYKCVAGLVFVISIVFTASAVIAGEASYTVTNLGPPNSLSRGKGINERGEIIGVYNVPPPQFFYTYPFLYSTESGILEIETIGGLEGWALDINESTEVVGYVEAEKNKAFIWTEDEGMQELPNGEGNSAAIAINNIGQIVGVSDDYPVMWTEEGEKVNLGALTGDALDINNLGQILIRSEDAHAFVWTEEDGMVPLETLGGEGSTPRRINDRGEIVGWSQIESGEYHAFLHTEENGIMDLETLGGAQSIALSINNFGWVVGHSDIAPAEERAFIWRATTGMKDLNTMIPADSGWVLLSAEDINDAGQIVGEGKINGQTRAFLLTPIRTQVAIDIKPRRDTNYLFITKKGHVFPPILPVAIPSDEDFYAPDEVDITSLTFGLTGYEYSLKRCAKRNRDVNQDGLKDLVCYFLSNECGFQAGDTEGILKGQTMDGMPIEGFDTVDLIEWPWRWR